MFETTPEWQATHNPKRPSLRGDVRAVLRREPLDIVLGPSRYLRFFYLVVYIALMLLAFSLATLGGSFAFLAIALGLGFGLQLRYRLLWQAKQHWRVQCDSDGWWLGRARCGLKPAQLAGEVRLWQVFTFLTFVDERGKHPLVLLADSAAPDDLRRLRVWLVSHRSAC